MVSQWRKILWKKSMDVISKCKWTKINAPFSKYFWFWILIFFGPLCNLRMSFLFWVRNPSKTTHWIRIFCPDFNGVAVPLSQFREISYPIVNKIARMITKDRDMAIGSFLAKFPKFERWFRIPRSIFKDTYLKVGHYLQGKWKFLLLQEFFSGALKFFFSRLS